MVVTGDRPSVLPAPGRARPARSRRAARAAARELSRPSWGVLLAVVVLQLAASGVVVLDAAGAMSAAELSVTVLVTVAQAGAVLGLRVRPVPAFVAHCALSATAAALYLPWSGVGWLAVVYLVVRHGALGPVAAVAVSSVAVHPVSAAVDVLFRSADPVETGWELAEVVVVAGAQLALAALAGWARRALELRARQAREEDLRRRREAALAQERRRIGDELDAVVVEHLQRVAALASGCRARLVDAPAGPRPVLAELQQEARRTLTTMRRVLAVVRAETGSAAAAGAARRRPPLPTPGGIALGVVAAAATVLVTLLVRAPDLPPELVPLLVPAEPPSLPAPVMVAVQIAVLGWWRSAPVAALLVGTAASLGAFAAGIPASVADLGWPLLVYGTAVERPPRVSGPVVAGAGAAITAPLLVPGVHPVARSGAEIATDAVVWLVLVALVWAFGCAHRAARVRRDARTGHDLRRTVEQERHRIARELHDVIAQLVSAVAVQAGAALAVVDAEPRLVDELVGHVEEHGDRIRSALPDLMALSRPTDVVALDEAGVERLVAPARTAGLPVTVRVVGEPQRGRGETALFAQRILVEALTNVLRHAGASPTRVSVEHGPDEVAVEVADSGRAPAGRVPASAGEGSGLGLVGMRERAALLGGTVEVGPEPDGGWRVVARLPQQQLAAAAS